jgi:hypothetical protein
MNSPGKMIRSRGAANGIGSREDMREHARPKHGHTFPNADAAAI